MMRPHALDANAINTFQKERFGGQAGPAHAAIDIIFQSDCVALDDGGLCQQEWERCAGGAEPLAIKDWVADQMIYGKIRLYRLCPNTIHKELIRLGLPKDDHKWVRLAIGCGGRIIISDDVDFFDPTKKRATAKVKNRIKDAGKGPCSKKLQKNFQVEIKRLCDIVS